MSARVHVIILPHASDVLMPEQVSVRAPYGTDVAFHQHPLGTSLCMLYVSQSDGTVQDYGVGNVSECEA